MRFRAALKRASRPHKKNGDNDGYSRFKFFGFSTKKYNTVIFGKGELMEVYAALCWLDVNASLAT